MSVHVGKGNPTQGIVIPTSNFTHVKKGDKTMFLTVSEFLDQEWLQLNLKKLLYRFIG